MLIIPHLRKYEADKTTGIIYLDNKVYSTTLEDQLRPFGKKFPGVTCIHEGAYYVSVTWSPKFQMEMILLYTNKETYKCEYGGIVFDGVRVHGGTSVLQTDACVLTPKWKELIPIVKAERAMRQEVLWIIAEAPK